MRPYALQPEHSRGRRFAEPPHRYRNPYQRDRDRIVHARAFRRLENKTQVFTSPVSDHFRNRLTHTIETAQISRTIASVIGLNEDLVEALALVHDIGHPPFGHTGEWCLNEIMQRFGDRFDHNLQALRIVEFFEQRYARFPGLNLTFEVREGIIKHSRDYDPASHPDLAEYCLDQRPPLEAQLIDLADEVAYNTADLDDGMEARLLNLDSLLSELELFRDFYREAERLYPSAPQKLLFNEANKSLINHLATDLMEHTLSELSTHSIQSVEDVRNFPARLVGFSPEVRRHKDLIKKYLYKHLYTHADFVPAKEAGRRIIQDLFQLYLDDPSRMPASYAAQTREMPPQRVICDYIAGMTDSYIQKLDARTPGSEADAPA